MVTIILSLFSSARQAFQTRAALQAEILALRHQLLMLQRSSRGHRLPLSRADRFLWVWLARFWSAWRSPWQNPYVERLIGTFVMDNKTGIATKRDDSPRVLGPRHRPE